MSSNFFADFFNSLAESFSDEEIARIKDFNAKYDGKKIDSDCINDFFAIFGVGDKDEKKDS